jgi:hypothetical protein
MKIKVDRTTRTATTKNSVSKSKETFAEILRKAIRKNNKGQTS